MKTKSLTSLFAVALALVACNKNGTDPVFTPELKLDKTEKITAAAEGTTANLKVTANVSWTVTSNDETVATVEPASKEITDKKSAETEVTVTISENETLEPRTATLTFKAEGCKDIVVEIEQAAAEIPDVFEVLDDTGENPAPASFDVTFPGGSNTVYVNSNINWTATSSAPTWLTVNPVSFTTEVKEVEPTAVTITADANTGDARSATITFSAEGHQDVVITVNQAKASTLTISVDNITYQSADVTFTSTSTTDVYYYVLTLKSTYDQLLSQGYTPAEVVYYFLHMNASSYSMTDAEFLAIVGSTETYTQSYAGLPESSELIALACYFDANVNPISNAAEKVFTTPAKPGADADYTALLGTYSFNAYNYFDEVPVTGATFLVEEGVVNESYKISLPGSDWGPEQGQYIDHFECPWDKTGKKSFTIPQEALGDEGISWNYGTLGTCGIKLDIFYSSSEDPIEAVVLTADASGNLYATAPAIPQGDYVCFQSGIYNEEGETGYANGIFIFNSGLNFTKQVAPAAKNAVQHSVFEMQRIFKNKEFKAHKVTGKLSIR